MKTDVDDEEGHELRYRRTISLTHSLTLPWLLWISYDISRNWVFIRISLKLSCDSAIKGTHVTVKGCLAADGRQSFRKMSLTLSVHLVRYFRWREYKEQFIYLSIRSILWRESNELLWQMGTVLLITSLTHALSTISITFTRTVVLCPYHQQHYYLF